MADTPDQQAILRETVMDKRTQKVLDMKHGGMRGIDIARELGVKPDVVYRIVRANGERYHAEAGSDPKVEPPPSVEGRLRKKREADLMEACRDLAQDIVCYCARCVDESELAPDEEEIAQMIRSAL